MNLFDMTLTKSAMLGESVKEYTLKEANNIAAAVKEAKELAKAQIETLGERIRKELPEVSESIINKIKGNIVEGLMDSVFKKQGWVKLEGEYGVNGIDGLYIKRNKDGVIVDVLICESKYNTSKLGTTNDGKQMSKEWILSKLDTLIEKYPDNKEYAQIKKMVENDNYRPRLIQVKEINGKLQIEFYKVDSDGNLIPLNGRENYKSNGLKIDLNNPETSYETEVAETYDKIVQDEIEKYKNKKENNHEKTA